MFYFVSLMCPVDPKPIQSDSRMRSEGKGHPPQQAKVAQGVPGWLSPWIFLTFGTTMVVGHQHWPPLSQEKSLVLTFRG